MITAKEAHDLASKNSLHKKVLKDIENKIKKAVDKGEFALIYECRVESDCVVSLVVQHLKDIDYNILYVPGIKTICIEW